MTVSCAVLPVSTSNVKQRWGDLLVPESWSMMVAFELRVPFGFRATRSRSIRPAV